MPFPLRKIGETATTITLGWDRQPGDGYRFYADGKPVARTFNPAVVQTRFSKAGSYEVRVLHVREGDSGRYPPPVGEPETPLPTSIPVTP